MHTSTSARAGPRRPNTRQMFSTSREINHGVYANGFGEGEWGRLESERSSMYEYEPLAAPRGASPVPKLALP